MCFSLLVLSLYPFCCFFFFFNDTATTEIYTLSLHDALPVSADLVAARWGLGREELDAYAARSHQRAHAAQSAGHFEREIVGIRSEERRVGKECRSRWSPYH